MKTNSQPIDIVDKNDKETQTLKKMDLTCENCSVKNQASLCQSCNRTLCEDCADFYSGCLTCGSMEVLHAAVDKQRKKIDTYIEKEEKKKLPFAQRIKNYFSFVSTDRFVLMFSILIIIYMMVCSIFQFFFLKNIYGDCKLQNQKEFIFKAYDKL